MFEIPQTYELAREHFRGSLEMLQRRWPDAQAGAHALSGQAHLTIDWIATSLPRQRLLVITTGEHGIEAYAGAAVLDMLTAEFLPRLDPENTGLLLVHAINPWGMKHRRRVNANNIDLNRNFVMDENELSPDVNLDYARLDGLLNPRRKLANWPLSWARFLAGAAQNITSMGMARLRTAVLSGQYCQPEGVYYGGTALQEETRLVASLYRQYFARAGHILHIDLHTGYGPQGRMLLVNSPLEKRSPDSLAREFDYPLVTATSSQQFYAIHGDMIDFVYRLAAAELPDQRLFATAFEFGTLGDSILEHLRDVHAMITENQCYHYGAAPAAGRAARHDFEELYLPGALAWRTGILEDARRAAAGILKAEGFIV